MNKIARLPIDDSLSDDEHCSVCGDDNVVLVIAGSNNCHYCGNQVNLCSKCCGVMKRELNDIDDGLNIKVGGKV